jgi:hypothetical protein
MPWIYLFYVGVSSPLLLGGGGFSGDCIRTRQRSESIFSGSGASACVLINFIYLFILVSQAKSVIPRGYVPEIKAIHKYAP